MLIGAITAGLSGLAVTACATPTPSNSTDLDASRVAQPTAVSSPAGFAVDGGAIEPGPPPTIPVGQIPDRVGQLVSVQARVKWCQIGTGVPAVYALDNNGTIRFEIAAEDQVAFTRAQLTAFCGSVRLHGVVDRDHAKYVIAVITPDQVTAVAPQ